MNMSRDVVFSLRHVRFHYPDSATAAVSDVSLDVMRGEFVAFIGPNGSGKSTLLRLMLGALRADGGSVLFQGRDVQQWPRAGIAREIGVLAQSEEFPFPLSVRELAGMGRYPHLGAWRGEGAADRAAVETAMRQCGVAGLAGRSVATLSGGERQRARLARALAQETETLVFDEPTAALDIAHEMTLFELLASLSTAGRTLVLVTHNINLAARYAHRMVLLRSGTVAAAGAAADVITRDNIEPVYQWPVRITTEDDRPQVVPVRPHRS